MTRNFVQKNTSVLLQAVADVTQAVVGEGMGGKQPSYVSRFFSGEQKITCEEMHALLNVCGLALHRLGEADLIVPVDDWKGMVRLAKKYMENIEC